MFDLIASSGTILTPQLTATVHDAIVSVFSLALTGLVTAAGVGIKLWINSMQSGWKRALAERLVKYAEQKYLNNDEKLQYVSQKMSEHFPRLSQEEIHHLLEAAVHDLPSGTAIAKEAAIVPVAATPPPSGIPPAS